MHNVLQFDYEDVDGLRVIKCLGLGAKLCSDRTWSYEKIIFILADRSALVISVTKDTDELIFDRTFGVSNFLGRGGSRARHLDLNIVELGWCWIGTNWRGYKDMLVIGSGGIEPNLMFVAQASMINFYEIRPLLKE